MVLQWDRDRDFLYTIESQVNPVNPVDPVEAVDPVNPVNPVVPVTSVSAAEGHTYSLSSVTESSAIPSSNSNSPLATSHSFSMTGLEPCTTFYTRPLITDAFGNTRLGEETSFTTTGECPVVQPVVQQVQNEGLLNDSLN